MDPLGQNIKVGGSAKDREAAEMMQLLELSKDDLGTGKLPSSSQPTGRMSVCKFKPPSKS